MLNPSYEQQLRRRSAAFVYLIPKRSIAPRLHSAEFGSRALPRAVAERGRDDQRALAPLIFIEGVAAQGGS